MTPTLYIMLDSRLYKVEPKAMHTYFGSINISEYEIQNWNDSNTWSISENTFAYYPSEECIIGNLKMYYDCKRYDLIARLIVGTDAKECIKNLTCNSLPTMAKWPYEKTLIEHPCLKTILSDKKVISEIEKLKK